MNSISSNCKGVRSTHGFNSFNQRIGQYDIKVLNMNIVICETVSVSKGDSDRGNNEIKSTVSICNVGYTDSCTLYNMCDNKFNNVVCFQHDNMDSMPHSGDVLHVHSPQCTVHHQGNIAYLDTVDFLHTYTMSNHSNGLCFGISTRV